jgi:hypothetical protein
VTLRSIDGNESALHIVARALRQNDKNTKEIKFLRGT